MCSCQCIAGLLETYLPDSNLSVHFISCGAMQRLLLIVSCKTSWQSQSPNSFQLHEHLPHFMDQVENRTHHHVHQHHHHEHHPEDHVCNCFTSSTATQSLEELEFQRYHMHTHGPHTPTHFYRGLWTAALNGDINRVKMLLSQRNCNANVIHMHTSPANIMFNYPDKRRIRLYCFTLCL